MSDPPDPPFVVARPAVRGAVEYATTMHVSQLREADRAPFILHPLEVAALLSGRDLDDDVVAAGVLHDVVENTPARTEDVEERFGPRVAALVAAVTEDPRIADYEERKAALRAQVAAAGPGAQAVYAADKIAKARELRAHVASGRAALSDPALQRRLEHYARSLDLLREAGTHPRMADQLAFELWALRALPPA